MNQLAALMLPQRWEQSQFRTTSKLTFPKLPTPSVLLMRYWDILSSAEPGPVRSAAACKIDLPCSQKLLVKLRNRAAGEDFSKDTNVAPHKCWRRKFWSCTRLKALSWGWGIVLLFRQTARDGWRLWLLWSLQRACEGAIDYIFDTLGPCRLVLRGKLYARNQNKAHAWLERGPDRWQFQTPGAHFQSWRCQRHWCRHVDRFWVSVRLHLINRCLINIDESHREAESSKGPLHPLKVLSVTWTATRRHWPVHMMSHSWVRFSTGRHCE